MTESDNRPAHVHIQRAVEGLKLDIILNEDARRQLAEQGRAQLLLDEDGPAAELELDEAMEAGRHEIVELWLNRT